MTRDKGVIALRVKRPDLWEGGSMGNSVNENYSF